jgi:hypothetical protein
MCMTAHIERAYKIVVEVELSHSYTIYTECCTETTQRYNKRYIIACMFMMFLKFLMVVVLFSGVYRVGGV